MIDTGSHRCSRVRARDRLAPRPTRPTRPSMTQNAACWACQPQVTGIERTFNFLSPWPGYDQRARATRSVDQCGRTCLRHKRTYVESTHSRHASLLNWRTSASDRQGSAAEAYSSDHLLSIRRVSFDRFDCHALTPATCRLIKPGPPARVDRV